MIKGILALFSSGIIFRLPVLSGIIIGFYMMFTLSDEEIMAVFHSPHVYMLGLIISAVYAFIFKRIYKKGGGIVDWNATVYSIFGHFLSYIVALVCSCLFILAISFGGFDNGAESSDVSNPQLNEIINNIQKMGY